MPTTVNLLIRGYRRTYGDEDQGRDIRTGFEPSVEPADTDFAIGEDEGDDGDDSGKPAAPYDDMHEPNVWSDSGGR